MTRGTPERAGGAPEGLVLRVPDDVVRALAAHAEELYPEECCGALLGGAEIALALPFENRHPGERARRYLIGPGDVLGAERRAEREGCDVVGYYHSHPDHPAVPSETDRAEAWPWYVYVIVPVRDGRAGAPRGWTLRPDRGGFDEVTLAAPASDSDDDAPPSPSPEGGPRGPSKEGERP